jgi:hypothetical protein
MLNEDKDKRMVQFFRRNQPVLRQQPSRAIARGAAETTIEYKLVSEAGVPEGSDLRLHCLQALLLLQLGEDAEGVGQPGHLLQPTDGDQSQAQFDGLCATVRQRPA